METAVTSRAVRSAGNGAGADGAMGRLSGRGAFSVPVKVQIEQLLPADSPRLDGENEAHARMLAESESELPPILVHRATMRIIDGMHRLRAAVLRGRDTVDVRFFDGPASAVFALAVETNIAHGLPLSLRDRESAAARILAEHPECSDRAIARVSGLSSKTVGAIRRRSAGDGPQVTARIGHDGRVRPLNSADGRRTASAYIAAKPDASLREIARDAGISIATARDVRERIKRGDDPIPAAQRRTNPAAAPPAASPPAAPSAVPSAVPSVAPDAAPKAVPSAAPDAGSNAVPAAEPGTSTVTRLRPRRGPYVSSLDRAKSVVAQLCKDPSLRFSESGRTLLRWLDSRVAEMEACDRLFDAAPVHSSYLLIEFAQCYGNNWHVLADQLKTRVDGAGLAATSP
ncbi:ParB N-terminal domain-containing protein [Dactylosporangium sp. NPDC050688]|uniref:ParB/RepB/Spo0J family partition protein n=1 Tax=Dactylosporangium sp. NPDC050688 TaxID=3157217 RepID=UPI0033FB3D56